VTLNFFPIHPIIAPDFYLNFCLNLISNSMRYSLSENEHEATELQKQTLRFFNYGSGRPGIKSHQSRPGFLQYVCENVKRRS
jgi:hypothetical protein